MNPAREALTKAVNQALANGAPELIEIPPYRCSRCDATDVVGPFEMDGIVNGEYHKSGQFWIVCRTCNGSTNVTQSEETAP